MKRAFVLLSGGVDSTTCLHIALNEFGAGNVAALSIDYGQRHFKERDYAESTCSRLSVPLLKKSIPSSMLGGEGVMLTDRDVEIPSISYDQIKGVSPTYVPFRNGNLLSLIAAHAQKWVVKQQAADLLDGSEETTEAGIYFGAHAEDAQNWAYPDCTPEFIGAMANAIYIGTYHAVRLYTPLMWMKKWQIIALGDALGVDWARTWSCYAGGEKHCGVCPTCRSRREGFDAAGVTDPTKYAG